MDFINKIRCNGDINNAVDNLWNIQYIEVANNGSSSPLKKDDLGNY